MPTSSGKTQASQIPKFSYHGKSGENMIPSIFSHIYVFPVHFQFCLNNLLLFMLLLFEALQ